ncbi:hypothetical protein P8H27_05530 [Pseudomonas sp. sp1636]|uniref:hypothetical protein n=1 Tax=Pseudomonas sp. sp1636 TaxID=3036707 RepID=UPI0025A50DE9|nr:hypothetical protein [Pseudomonas sp. sp1636]MDM8348353.1 hypothetical protein [Pseudomonas sp. sp1636]
MTLTPLSRHCTSRLPGAEVEAILGKPRAADKQGVPVCSGGDEPQAALLQAKGQLLSAHWHAQPATNSE